MMTKTQSKMTAPAIKRLKIPHALMMLCIVAVVGLLLLSMTTSLNQVSAHSGMPPHPGPDANEDPYDFASCQDHWNEDRSTTERKTLTDEQNARMVTKRQTPRQQTKNKR